MDITIPSNFERYLFHLHGNNPATIRELMESIKTNDSLPPFDAAVMQRVRGQSRVVRCMLQAFH